MSEKTNKFVAMIADNGTATLKKRAKSLSQAAEIAQQNLLNNLINKKSELELRMMDLTDFGPDSTDSLRPGNKDWHPTAWVEELQQIKQQLYQVDIQIKLAKETYDEYFKVL